MLMPLALIYVSICVVATVVISQAMAVMALRRREYGDGVFWGVLSLTCCVPLGLMSGLIGLAYKDAEIPAILFEVSLALISVGCLVHGLILDIHMKRKNRVGLYCIPTCIRQRTANVGACPRPKRPRRLRVVGREARSCVSCLPLPGAIFGRPRDR